MITGMSKLFGKSKEEIKRIFCTEKEMSTYTQTNIKSKGHFQQIINGYKEETYNLLDGKTKPQLKLRARLKRKGVHFD